LQQSPKDIDVHSPESQTPPLERLPQTNKPSKYAKNLMSPLRTNVQTPGTTLPLFRRTCKRQKPRVTPSDERTNAKNHDSTLQANAQTPPTTLYSFRRTYQHQQPRFTLSDERTNARNHTSSPGRRYASKLRASGGWV
jgi:hypothetical protein